MPTQKPFDVNAAIAYSNQWALSRNPRYYNFDKIGGDCTNFISQCVYAGSGVMNHTPIYGWYYYSVNQRSPSWTSVNYFYRFMTTNKTKGPFGSAIPFDALQIGDLIQLQNTSGIFYHNLLVVDIIGELNEQNIIINAHDIDSFRRPLSTYTYMSKRCLHINGVYL